MLGGRGGGGGGWGGNCKTNDLGVGRKGGGFICGCGGVFVFVVVFFWLRARGRHAAGHLLTGAAP